MRDLVNSIIAYEDGQYREADEVLEFYADLIKTGVAWQLQGSYGRTAAALIEAGYVSREGEILLPADDRCLAAEG